MVVIQPFVYEVSMLILLCFLLPNQGAEILISFIAV